ncbi:MAG: type II toxin-antitoxin system RelE family toxin, partial [Nitrospiraceae bacterium]
MASYSLQFKPSVEKDLDALPKPLIARVLSRIEQLHDDPFPHQAAKLQGAERLYRLRVGDYRIVYELDQQALRIVVHSVRLRSEVYRRLRLSKRGVMREIGWFIVVL